MKTIKGPLAVVGENFKREDNRTQVIRGARGTNGNGCLSRKGMGV